MRVLLVYGGESPEHEVSIISARNIFEGFRHSEFQVTLCFIDKSGEWYLASSFDDPTPKKLQIDTATRAIRLADTQATLQIDVMFPALHGEGGEDGKIQALASSLGIPVVGCGVYASEICMDKTKTKDKVRSIDIPVVPALVHTRRSPISYAKAVSTLGDELFVKPSSTGSSVGVSKVRNASEYKKAVILALKYGEKVLVERAIRAREIEIAILGDNSDLYVSVCGEIVPDREFYDYDSKYSSDSTTSAVIPADLEECIAHKISEYARRSFIALGCNGLARLDFFVEGKKIYLNEVNTMPGFTPISMFPKLCLAGGFSYLDILRILVNTAK